MPKIHDKSFEIYISSGEITKRIKELAIDIEKDYQGKSPLFIAILNGAFIFAADLLRELDIDAELTFIKFKSYNGFNSSGQVQSLVGLSENIENRDVVILDDIVDSGLTVENLIKELGNHNPASIKTCSLLYKKEAFKANFKVDYYGFEIRNKFVVGYGLDYDGKGRHLKDIYVLSE